MDVDAEGVAGPATEEFDEAILSAADFELNSAARAKAVGANALEVETAELELVAGRCKSDHGQHIGIADLAGTTWLHEGAERSRGRHAVHSKEEVRHGVDRADGGVTRCAVEECEVAVAVLLVGKADGDRQTACGENRE